VLTRWAAAGFVVAAPTFPLTNGATPGGTDQADTDQQPGDVSYVITSVLGLAAAPSGTLAGLVDPAEIGAAGHSNGAITTLGLAADTCCRDTRVKAAAVLSGSPAVYPNGVYEYTSAPPLLVVHGTDDPLLPYGQMVDVYNSLRGPKGILTLEGADHGSWVFKDNRYFPVALQATTDFFDAYLRGDTAALRRLPADQAASLAVMDFEPQVGSTATIPTVTEPTRARHAQVTPTSNLTNGQTVTVQWSGFLPGKVVNVVECAPDPSRTSAACDLTHGRILTPDPTGSGGLTLTVVEGRVGNGVCDASHTGCQIAVNDASLMEADATLTFPITFAP